MTRTVELESFALLSIAAVAGILIAFYGNHSPKIRTTFNLPVVAPLTSPTPTAAPTPKPTTFSQISPNGLKKVTMTVTEHSKTSVSYAFSISSGDGSNPQPLYSINLPIGEYMSIPFNTFSPDNKYLFLEHTTKDATEAFAFRTDGTSLGDTSQYDNIKDIFTARQTGFTYQTTTGWASETLLIVNTTKVDGSKGPSYWVELPSKAVIQLSTEF